MLFFVGLFKENHTDVSAKIIADRFESSFARSDRWEIPCKRSRRENRTKGKWDSLVERKDGFISRTLKSDLARDRRFEPWVEERYHERASERAEVSFQVRESSSTLDHQRFTVGALRSRTLTDIPAVGRNVGVPTKAPRLTRGAGLKIALRALAGVAKASGGWTEPRGTAKKSGEALLNGIASFRDEGTRRMR